jgi:hypothetical protein
MKSKLSARQHLELGALLKQVRRDLLDAAVMAKPYASISQQLFDAANALTMPRSFLEKRLFDECGGEYGDCAGKMVRDVYFGEFPLAPKKPPLGKLVDGEA